MYERGVVLAIGYKQVQKIRTTEAHGGDDELTAQANFGKSWRDFPKSVWLLVQLTTFICNCFICEVF